MKKILVAMLVDEQSLEYQASVFDTTEEQIISAVISNSMKQLGIKAIIRVKQEERTVD